MLFEVSDNLKDLGIHPASVGSFAYSNAYVTMPSNNTCNYSTKVLLLARPIDRTDGCPGSCSRHERGIRRSASASSVHIRSRMNK